MRRIYVAVLFATMSFSAISGNTHQYGKIRDISAVTGGLLIKLDSGAPDNCANTPYGWLLVKSDRTTIISVVLASWAAGSKTGTIYTTGLENGNGYCLVNQFDPTD